MGILQDAYAWVDRNVAGGFLPGGEPELGVPLAGAIERIAGQFAPGTQLPSGFRANGVPAVIPRAPLGPVGVPGLAPTRGRLQTLVARQMPDGTVIPVRTMPGQPVLMSSDFTAARRVCRVGSKIKKMFPSARASRKKYGTKCATKK